MDTSVTARGLRRGPGAVLVLAGVLAVGGCSAAQPADREQKSGGPEPSACSLLNVEDVRTTFRSQEPFTGTPLDRVDGKRPWGCTWGSRTSYASVEEVSPEEYSATIKAPGALAVPLNIGTGESFSVYPADDDQPMKLAFATGDRSYKLDVVPARDGDYPRYRQGDIGIELLRLLVPAVENARQ